MREDLNCRGLDGAPLELRRYTPPRGGDAGVLYLHGGGWVAGDLDTHAGVCASLAVESGASVFALDYRRPPEHRFPIPFEDGLAALMWLIDQAARFGLDRNRLAVVGDSAGANLVAAMLLDPRAPDVALQALLCPILDLPGGCPSRDHFRQGFFISDQRLTADMADYLGPIDPEAPQASPLGARDLSRLPPTLIHAAGFDPFRDEALAFGARLAAAGVRVESTVHQSLIHYFYALPRTIPAARPALAAFARQLRDALDGTGQLARPT